MIPGRKFPDGTDMMGITRDQAVQMLQFNREVYDWAQGDVTSMGTWEARGTEPRGRYIYAGNDYIQEQDETKPNGELIPADSEMEVRVIVIDNREGQKPVGKIVPNVWCEDLHTMKCL